MTEIESFNVACLVKGANDPWSYLYIPAKADKYGILVVYIIFRKPKRTMFCVNCSLLFKLSLSNDKLACSCT